MPNRFAVQLLRSCFPFVELFADAREQGLGFYSLSMHGGDGQMSLTSVRGQLAATGKLNSRSRMGEDLMLTKDSSPKTS